MPAGSDVCVWLVKGCFGSGNVCCGVLLLSIFTLLLQHGLMMRQGGEAACCPVMKDATAWRHSCLLWVCHEGDSGFSKSCCCSLQVN